MTSALTIADRPVDAIAILAIVVLNAMVDELAARPPARKLSN